MERHAVVRARRGLEVKGALGEAERLGGGRGVEQRARAEARESAARVADAEPRLDGGEEERGAAAVLLDLRDVAAADVVAIPQLDSEPSRYQMPMKVFDAMAMGKPIVASSVSDLPLVLEGCGRLVPPGDVEKLAAAISELLSYPEEARVLGERARARCLESYSMQRIGEKLFEVVRQVTP